jgi:hypothetical protein
VVIEALGVLPAGRAFFVWKTFTFVNFLYPRAHAFLRRNSLENRENSDDQRASGKTA